MRLQNHWGSAMGAKHFILTILTTLFAVATCFSQNFKVVLRGETELENQFLNTLSSTINISSESDLSNFMNDLDDRLQSEGYLDAKITLEKSSIEQAELLIWLGPRITEILLSYPSTNSNLDFCTNTIQCDKTGIAITFNTLKSYLEYLANQLSDQGQPFSKVQLTNIKRTSTQTLKAELTITPSDLRKLDDIILKGYDKFPKSFLRYYSNLKMGKAVSVEQVKKKVTLLNQLDFVEIPRDPALLFTQEKTNLYIYVSKVKANLFDGFLGFGGRDDSNQSGVFGLADLSLINNLNYGEELRFKYRKQGSGQTEFDFQIKAPFLFKTPISLSLGLNIFRKDSLFQNNLQSLGLVYQQNPSWSYQLHAKSNQSVAISDAFGNFTTIFYGGGVEFRTPSQSNYALSTATVFSLGADLGRRKSSHHVSQQSALFFAGQYEFLLNKRQSIYSNIQAQYLFSEAYLHNELLRLGGVKSLRGFEENSISTSGYSLLRSEYRYKLDGSTYIHSVLDFGLVNDMFNQKANTFSGVGLGLARQQFKGVFQLQFVLGQNNQRAFSLKDSKLHLEFSSKF